jgi:WD40 repeat protein
MMKAVPRFTIYSWFTKLLLLSSIILLWSGQFIFMSLMPVELSVIKKSSQSNQLTTREYDNQISIQNQKVFGDIIYRITDHSERITGISFSPNSSLLVSCDLHSILITDLYDGHVRETVNTVDSWYPSLAISPDGSSIAIGERLTTGFKVKILNINTKKEVNNIDIEHLNSLLYSPDGLKIAVISENAPEIKIFSAYSGDHIYNLKQSTESNAIEVEDIILVHSIDFSPDGSYIVSSLEERFYDPLIMTNVVNYSLVIWDMKNKAVYRTIRNSARMESVKFSSDGMLLASGGADGVLKLWDTRNGKLIWEKSDHESHVINSIDFSSDSMTLTSGDANGIIKVRNITNGEVIAEFEDQSGEGILAVVYSPDSTLLASATRKEDGGSIILRNMARGVEKEPELYLHGDVVHSTAISPDGLKIASGSADGTVKLRIGNNNLIMLFLPLEVLMALL